MTTTSTPFALRLDWARSLFDHGDFSAAATALRELVDESASSEHLHGTTELRLLLARAYFGSAQLGRAETVLRGLIEDAPDDGYLHLLLGRTLQRQRRHDDAQRHLALAEVLGDYERPAAYGAPTSGTTRATE
jgi:Flp pilus assembly protein TadD